MKKKSLIFLVLSLTTFLFLSLAACYREVLAPPAELSVNPSTQVLTWSVVYESTGGYEIEINGVIHRLVPAIEVNNVFVSFRSYSLAALPPGEHIIRVRALTADRNFFRDSEWSEPYTWTKPEDSGLRYRRINANTEYEVYGIGNAPNDVIIGEYLNGRPITSIANSAFSGSQRLRSVKIGRNVTRIGASAFISCSNLEEVIIGENVRYIGERAFQWCRSLTSIYIPQNVRYIGDNAFRFCSGLTSIKIPDTVLSIGDGIFSEAANLREIIIGNGVRRIGDETFFNNSNLTSVIIGSNVASIGFRAFFNTTSLEELVLPYGLIDIDDEAFSNSINLSYIEIPNSVTRIGTNVFFNTQIWDSQLGVVYAGSSEIGYWVVGYRNTYDENENRVLTTNISLRNNTLGISDRAFAGHTALAAISLGNSLTNIGLFAFARNTALSNIIIPSSVERVGQFAFYDSGIWNNSAAILVLAHNWVVGTRADASFTPIDLNNIVGIGDGAFWGFGWLGAGGPVQTGISFSVVNIDSLRHIGANAFRGSLLSNDNLILPEGITKIRESAFRGVNIDSISIPNTVTKIGNLAFYESWLRSVSIPENITEIGNFAFSNNTRLTEVVIESTALTIGEGAFRHCINLTDIVLPEGTTSIGRHAFRGCFSLENIVIPQSVTYIGAHAFQDCINLTSIIIPKNVVDIGDFAFYGCVELSNVVIKYGVATIGNYAFFGCISLSNLIIPSSVVSIGNYAFKNCTNLKSITIPDSVISIGIHAFFGNEYLTIYREALGSFADWDVAWNSSNRPVIWGVTLSLEGYVVSFIRNVLSIFNANSENGILPPYRKGHSFVGWSIQSDSSQLDFTAEDVYQASFGTRLYAIWTIN